MQQIFCWYFYLCQDHTAPKVFKVDLVNEWLKVRLHLLPSKFHYYKLSPHRIELINSCNTPHHHQKWLWFKSENSISSDNVHEEKNFLLYIINDSFCCHHHWQHAQNTLIHPQKQEYILVTTTSEPAEEQILTGVQASNGVVPTLSRYLEEWSASQHTREVQNYHVWAFEPITNQHAVKKRRLTCTDVTEEQKASLIGMIDWVSPSLCTQRD